VFDRGGRSNASSRGGVLASLHACRFALVAWIAVLALVAQLGLAAQRPAMANAGQADGAAVLGALSALLGPNVALCLHEDGSAPGSPSHDSHDCCIDCALCQTAGHSAALVPPDLAGPVPFARLAGRLIGNADAHGGKPVSVASAQPRGPPAFI
jgi:hypothetical protein